MANTQKLYCYVDETGQDTKGRFFLVAIVITCKERERLILELERIEDSSLKGIRKWKNTKPARRIAYLDLILASQLLINKINYAVFLDRNDYQDLTIIATAKAIISIAPINNYEALVYVDGLSRTDRFVVGAGLRHRHVKVKMVRGLTDESSSLIRLADAMAGFVRDYLEGDPSMRSLYKKAVDSGLIRKL